MRIELIKHTVDSPRPRFCIVPSYPEWFVSNEVTPYADDGREKTNTGTDCSVWIEHSLHSRFVIAHVVEYLAFLICYIAHYTSESRELLENTDVFCLSICSCSTLILFRNSLFSYNSQWFQIERVYSFISFILTWEWGVMRIILLNHVNQLRKLHRLHLKWQYINERISNSSHESSDTIFQSHSASLERNVPIADFCFVSFQCFFAKIHSHWSDCLALSCIPWDIHLYLIWYFQLYYAIQLEKEIKMNE